MRFRTLGLVGFCAVGSISSGLTACSGEAFTGKDSASGAENDLRGKGASGEGGSTTDGPDQSKEPEPKPVGGSANATGGNGGTGNATGGNATSGNAAGGRSSSGAGGTPDVAGSGGSLTPPDEGVAGEPNTPELPPETGCDSPIHDTWDAALGSSESDWKVDFGDPRVDTANQRLIVSYDDVAARKTPLVDGYYLTAEVTFEGSTVLTPYPYVSEVLLPSLRRNAAGTGIQLGSTQYGQGNSWHGDLPAGFAGKTLTDTNKVLVTTYIKASSKALAVKVQSGNQVYRSGWVTGFTWPQTNLGVFRYVGENNSSVYGSGDAVYVGPVDGCQGLSDAAVAARYDD